MCNRADRVVSRFREQFIAARAPIISACQHSSKQDTAEAHNESDQRGSGVHVASLRPMAAAF